MVGRAARAGAGDERSRVHAVEPEGGRLGADPWPKEELGGAYRRVGLRSPRASPDAEAWADRIDRGLVRMTTLTRPEVGYSARTAAAWRAAGFPQALARPCNGSGDIGPMTQSRNQAPRNGKMLGLAVAER